MYNAYDDVHREAMHDYLNERDFDGDYCGDDHPPYEDVENDLLTILDRIHCIDIVPQYVPTIPLPDYDPNDLPF